LDGSNDWLLINRVTKFTFHLSGRLRPGPGGRDPTAEGFRQIFADSRELRVLIVAYPARKRKSSGNLTLNNGQDVLVFLRIITANERCPSAKSINEIAKIEGYESTNNEVWPRRALLLPAATRPGWPRAPHIVLNRPCHGANKAWQTENVCICPQGTTSHGTKSIGYFLDLAVVLQRRVTISGDGCLSSGC